MLLEGKKVGFALTGSFCTFNNTIPQMVKLIEEGAEIIPIMSFNAHNMNTKFGKAEDFINQIKKITNNEIIHTIDAAEPIGPKHLTDVMIIAPCSGNTMGKMANGITDTPVLMAAKSHLRNENPLVIAISTNDGLSRKCGKYRKTTEQKTFIFCSV